MFHKNSSSHKGIRIHNATVNCQSLRITAFLVVFCICSVGLNVTAQTYFPTCNDLVVTALTHNQTHDTVFVTVKNSCDTCDQHAYTGLIIRSSEDTLALDIRYGINQSPENNNSSVYTLQTYHGEIGFSDELKIGMFTVCDSIPVSGDIVLSDEKPVQMVTKVRLKGNNLLQSIPGQEIKDVLVYNLSGQLMLADYNIFSTEYALEVNRQGLYMVTVRLVSGEFAILKYLTS